MIPPITIFLSLFFGLVDWFIVLWIIALLCFIVSYLVRGFIHAITSFLS